MEYIEMKVYTSVPGIEMVTGILLERGITETVVSDPTDLAELLDKKNAYEWDYVNEDVMNLADQEPAVSVYFEKTEETMLQIEQIKEDVGRLKEQVEKGLLGDVDPGKLLVKTVVTDDGQWKDKWKAYFKPAKVTEKLVIKPTWEEYTPEPGQSVIEIDPGMAFGTGTHETTSMCLLLIEKYMKKNCAVLDVGCGSGILSIGAALLGSKNVLGVDLDPEAVTVSRDNVKRNHVDHQVKIASGDLTEGIDFQADIVAANLMADLVMVLSKSIMNHIKPGGVFISSGILVEKEDLVKKAIEDAGFQILEITEKGEWCAIAAARE